MSLRAAVNAMCKSCIYDPIGGGGTWRQQVEACTASRCPLYPVRPKSAGNGAEDENEADLAPKPAVAARRAVAHKLLIAEIDAQALSTGEVAAHA